MKKRRCYNGNLPLKIMSNNQILSQYISLNHGPYYSERKSSLTHNTVENFSGITNFHISSRMKFSPDNVHSSKYYLKEKSKSDILSSTTSLTPTEKASTMMNKYQEIKSKHRVIYCEKNGSDDKLLKRSLEFIKKISKSNSHLEVLGNHLNRLDLCERNLENKRREFKKLVYGLDDKQFEEQESKGSELLAPLEVTGYKYPIECSDEELNKARSYLNCSKNKGMIIAVNNKSNIELSIDLVQCLRSQQWLNDELINFYFSMLQERNDRQTSKGSKPKVWLWNSFFYTKLTSEQNGKDGTGYCYKNVSRWTQRKKIDLFEYDIVLLPINVNNVHWTLGVVNFKLGYIQYIDSLGGQFQNHLGCTKMSAIFFQNMNRYIQDEYFDKKKKKFPNQLRHFTNFTEPVPQQNNGSDCGVFTCMFAECLSEGRSFDFDITQIDRIREVMLVECIRNEIF